VVTQLERELITRCLVKTGGNKRQAARLLQLSRTTLIDKLHRLKLLRGELSWPETADSVPVVGPQRSALT
jgi:DNA-binding NtrC family response regulator